MFTSNYLSSLPSFSSLFSTLWMGGSFQNLHLLVPFCQLHNLCWMPLFWGVGVWSWWTNSSRGTMRPRMQPHLRLQHLTLCSTSRSVPGALREGKHCWEQDPASVLKTQAVLWEMLHHITWTPSLLCQRATFDTVQCRMLTEHKWPMLNPGL